jgi:hypothetical protein
MKKLIALLAVGLMGLFPLRCAAADGSIENLRDTTYELIRLLVQEGVLSRDKADALIREAQKRAAEEERKRSSKPPAVRVPYVPETVRREIREEIKQEVLSQAKAERWGEPGALPEWMDRIALEGDLRLRLQRDLFQQENAAPIFFQAEGQNINNTTDDRDRLRVRARIGLRAKVTDWLSGGIRLTSGSGDPLSTNQTLGSSFNKYQIFIDRAYLKLDPLPWLTASAGRIPNPWFGTDLVWNENLNFEGAALTLKPGLGNLNGFLTVGAFPLHEIEDTPLTLAKDKWLYGAQAGLEWTTASNSRFKFGVGLYDYRNTEGIRNTAAFPNAYDLTAPQFRQKGNSLFDINSGVVGSPSLFALAPRYRELNVTTALDLARFDPVHIVLTGDYVKNLGFDRSEILSRTGLDIAPETRGYAGRLLVGMPQLRQRGDWQTFVGYKYLERDAVLDAYTDSDFHLGGTNAKGYLVGGAYGLARNAWLTLRWLSSNEISGPPLSIDVLQLDFNARF